MINSIQTFAALTAAKAAHDAAVVSLRSAERALTSTKPFTIAKSRAIEALNTARQSVAATWDAVCHARANHGEMLNYERRFGIAS